MAVAVEPDLSDAVGAELPEEMDAALDVVGVDVGHHEEVEADVGPAAQALGDRVESGLEAAIHEDAARPSGIAVLDPEAVTVSGGEQVDREHPVSSSGSSRHRRRR